MEQVGVDPTTQDADTMSEKMAAMMVMEAYNTSIRTPPFQSEAITEFENEVFRGCYEEWTSGLEE